MARVQFIKVDTIKELTQLDENVDAKLITPVIFDVQEMELLPCLGTGLYDDLKAKIVASTTNAAEDILIQDYIAPMLARYVAFEMTDVLLFRYRNKGVVKKGSENSNPIDYKEALYLKDQSRNKAQMYSQKLIDYLCYNQTLFPTYGTIPNGGVCPRSNAYKTSIYLG